MRAATARFGARVPLLANMVEGGKTPVLPVADLERLGFSIAIFPGGTARAAAFAFAEYFASLKAHGTTAPYRDRMIDFDALQRLLGTADMLALGKRYDDSNA
jgi:2-methylisocitrate lyase-like PEP mutase family enzyme